MLRTGDPKDRVYGALYSLKVEDLETLDREEGCSKLYERVRETVHTASGEDLDAVVYKGCHFEPDARPLDWYKEHVVRGAKESGFPPDYIHAIEAVLADEDPDAARRARELSIYN